MFKHLRRRLTILFSVLTAAVLAAALTATCRMAQNEAVSGADLVFANTVSAIEDAVTENNLFHTQIGVRNRLDGGRRRVKKYLWSFFRTAPAGQVRL